MAAANLADHTTENALRQLATPSNLLAGHKIAQSGTTVFAAFEATGVRATVRMEGMNTRHTELALHDKVLRWRCSCTSNPTLFCKHLVATALAVQRKIGGDIYKAAGIIIQNRKLLHERSLGKPVFVAPGGRLEAGETPSQALVRELKEEISIDVKMNDLESIGTFTAEAANHPGQLVHMEVFMVKRWQGTIAPGAEVAELRWLDSNLPDDIEVGSIFAHDIIPMLHTKGLID